MTLKIAAAAIKQTPLDFEGNRHAVLAALEEAKKHNAKIVCYPELCLSGYGCEDAFYFDSVIQAGYESLQKLCDVIDADVSLIVGLPVKIEAELYNCVAVISQKKVKALIPKQFLANDGVHYEKRWFQPWERQRPSIKIALKGVNVNEPIEFGAVCVELHGIKVGFEICEDAWVGDEKRPSSFFADNKPDIVFNPSASHFAFGKDEIRRQLTIQGSNITQAVHVFVNQLGNESGRTIYDGDIIVGFQGKIISESSRLLFSDRSVFVFSLDNLLETQRNISPKADEDFIAFTKAASLGLYDYLTKSGANGFVLSLSGGADSAAVAVLVKAMIFFLVKEFGVKEAARRLKVNETSVTEAIVSERILHCVYQGTKQNSDTTRNAAKVVAENLNSAFSEIEIDDIVVAYQEQIQKITGRTFSWEQDDIALQNIQARTRSPGIWMLANINKALLLTTGNRSEAAVGYATMDGDTSGSLAPIAGVSKIFIQKWLHWLQANNVEGFGPFPWLKIITEQFPSAELRPLTQKQTDEKDLMPYVFLGFLEEMVLCQRISRQEVLTEAKKCFKQEYADDQMNEWIEKFYRHWTFTQWKRERLAPSFHLDRFSVDSRTWCRFPILSRGLPV